MKAILKRFIGSLILMLLVMVPVMAQDTAPITFSKILNDTFGMTGVMPEGWTLIGPGVWNRGSSTTDVTRLIQQSAPASPDAILTALMPQLGLDSAPDSVGTYKTDALTWTLYKIDVTAGGFDLSIDLGLANAEGKTFLVLLQTASDEYDTLHESVFLPVLDAFAPMTVEPTPTVPPPPYTAEDVWT